ncbi:GGDEF domain-containing protein [Sphingomonas sp. ABOLD]|uniref:GGDEF domain-containing protein n=1 Tax=unclassified Sphingomonas TaxID=196159 RepID=UPI000F7E2956|nr:MULTISPECIES: GGDEF domain-containing protein [unclassified Sphingomonas]RSV43987.1 GGDEF domain-containing protein [Sphingomonas sp. ABOLE]RSV45888.1 GGDEF domain-containing protein [Sphingomonas sp. ABOLD]
MLRRSRFIILALLPVLLAYLLHPFLPQGDIRLILHVVGIGGCILALIALVTGAPRVQAALRSRREEADRAHAERKQINHLFRMTEMLQSANGYPDANAVLEATISSLLDGFGAALYVFNNSRDRLELSGAWHWPMDEALRPMLTPAQCWALKRGKWHLNADTRGALRCEHHLSGISVLELPMAAHGEIQGLLKIATGRDDPVAELKRIQPLAAVIADAMSLAVSNIALREKLRTQALRDPLTGLYNRRYMEDALSRYAGLTERSGTPLSVIMIDLDHFKKLNDEFGHAVGDAVLRETASTIMSALRTSDVACRYGGEELLVILPECGIAEASAKAEILRERIEALSTTHDAKISASFGVASMPESTRSVADLLGLADAALYQAKGDGRNRVVAAPSREMPMLPLAAE